MATIRPALTTLPAPARPHSLLDLASPALPPEGAPVPQPSPAPPNPARPSPSVDAASFLGHLPAPAGSEDSPPAPSALPASDALAAGLFPPDAQGPSGSSGSGPSGPHALSAPSSSGPRAGSLRLDPSPVRAPPGFEYHLIEGHGLPLAAYVVRHSSFRAILYQPQIAGVRLQDRMEAAGRAFSRAILDLALSADPSLRRDRVVEVVLLSGGLFYDLNHGFKKELGFSLPQCFLGIRREKVAGTDGDFRAVATYENFESMPDQAAVLIGDTVATGATLHEALKHIGAQAQAHGQTLDRIVFVTLAGSAPGLEQLGRAHALLSDDHPGLATTFIAAEQLFHLMPDGTDLRFIGPDALAPPSARQHTLREYGPWLGEHMKCAVFDWGTRCKNPLAHYVEFEHVGRELLSRAPDEASRHALKFRLDEAARDRQSYQGPLLD